MSTSEENFLIDAIARTIYWGCLWLLVLGLIVCTVGGLAAVCMTVDLVNG